MTPRSFSVLAGLTVVAVAAAVATSAPRGGSGIMAAQGTSLFPDLLGQAKKIGTVRIERSDGQTTLTRTGDKFVDASGYPAKTDAVRRLVRSLAGLTIEERKTSDPKRHAEIGLAAPDAKKGAGTRVLLEAADHKQIAGVVVGERNYTVGGVNGGEFVRRAGDNQAWLVQGAVSLPSTRAGWFDTSLAEFKPTHISAVTIDNAKGSIMLVRGDKGLKLASVPQGATPNQDKIDRIVQAVAALSFDDVRKRAGDVPPTAPTITIALEDGSRVTLSRLGNGSDQHPWYRVETAPPVGKDPLPAVATLAKRAHGYDFQLGNSVTDVIGWTPDALVKQPQG